jgi:signal recognition particle subunit SRP54
VAPIVGLQGFGKPPPQASWPAGFRRMATAPLMASVDVYRPAEREQLRIVARDVNLPIYTSPPEQTLRADERSAGRNVVR